MKKFVILLAVILLVSVGCKKDDNKTDQSLIDSDSNETEQVEDQDKASSEGTEDAEHSEVSTEEEVSHTDIEGAGDEAFIPQAAFDSAISLKNAIDIKVSDADVKRIELEKEHESWEPRVLELYTEKDEILKLTATEPSDTGEMDGLTSYYYDEGELFFIEGPYANYVFIGGKLKVWSDEKNTILDMSDFDKEQRQDVLVDSLLKYLDEFDDQVK